jgi:hypothetical protein
MGPPGPVTGFPLHLLCCVKNLFWPPLSPHSSRRFLYFYLMLFTKKTDGLKNNAKINREDYKTVPSRLWCCVLLHVVANFRKNQPVYYLMKTLHLRQRRHIDSPPVSPSRGPGSIPQLFRCDLWWIKRQLGGLCSAYFAFPFAVSFQQCPTRT